MLIKELKVQECDLPAGRQAQRKYNQGTEVGKHNYQHAVK